MGAMTTTLDRIIHFIGRSISGMSLKRILITAFLLRLMAAAISHRYYQADEHFQVLEPAFGAVHGYWMKTWEWERGLRSWVFSGLLMPPLYLLKTLGVDNPWVSGAVIRALMGAFSLFGVYYGYRLAKIYLNEVASKYFSLLIAITPAFIFFGVRTQSESVCSVLGLIALVWILEKKPSDSGTKILLAGIVSGFAYMIRFQSGMFSLALGLVLLSQKRVRDFILFSFGILVMLVIQGWIDLLTWGNWFHSSIEYVRFNLIEGGAAAWFGEKPWHKLFLGVGRIFGFPNLLVFYGLGLFAIYKRRKEVLPLAIILILFQGFHHLLAHKEDRFLIPIFPELILLAGIGLREIWSRKTIRGVFIMLFVVAWLGRAVTWNWGFKDGTLLRTYLLGQDPKTRGVVLLGSGEHETGGYFYLRRNIPFQVARHPNEINRENFGRSTNRFVLGNRLDYPQPNLIEGVGLSRPGLDCVKLPEMGMNTWSCESRD